MLQGWKVTFFVGGGNDASSTPLQTENEPTK